MSITHTSSQAALMPLRPLAKALLADHGPDERGLCTGCLHLGRLVIAPCTHADWAGAVDNRLLTPATLELLGLPDPLEKLEIPTEPGAVASMWPASPSAGCDGYRGVPRR